MGFWVNLDCQKGDGGVAAPVIVDLGMIMFFIVSCPIIFFRNRLLTLPSSSLTLDNYCNEHVSFLCLLWRTQKKKKERQKNNSRTYLIICCYKRFLIYYLCHSNIINREYSGFLAVKSTIFN